MTQAATTEDIARLEARLAIVEAMLAAALERLDEQSAHTVTVTVPLPQTWVDGGRPQAPPVMRYPAERNDEHRFVLDHYAGDALPRRTKPQGAC